MLLHVIQLLLLLNSVSFNGVDSFSACDEIDVAFVIDVESVIADSEGVISFVTNVILSGSSEHTGFSVVIYGHNIPIDQKIKIVSLHDTKDATQRTAAEEAVDNALRKAFDHIKSVSSPAPSASYSAAHMDPEDHTEEDNLDENAEDTNTNDDDDIKPDDTNDAQTRNGDDTNDEAGAVESSAVKTKSIDIVPAFKIATGQSRPHHAGDRKLKLGYDPSDTSIIGDHDNQQVYIIFDHSNKLLRSGNDVDICALFHHLDTNQIRNDDEAVYFMMGQHYTKGDIEQIFCDNVIPSYIKKDTFYRYTPQFANNAQDMERIYCVTCPAEIKSPEYKGNINVGNHVQYLDLQTVIQCSLYYYDDDPDETTPDKLDETKSYVMVKDFVNDDNTFKVQDKLIVTQSIRKELKKLNCNGDVYQTVRIVKDNDAQLYNTEDTDESNDYQILKLYVQLPTNPMEYMQNANVHGVVKQHRFRNEKKKAKYSGYDEYSKAEYQEEDMYRDYDYEEEAGEDDEGEQETYDEVQILRGEMDHLLEEGSLLRIIAENVLKDRAQRMQRMAHQAVKLRKIRKILISTFPRHKRYYESKRFAAKVLKENRLMDGNSFGISLADLLLGRIKAHGQLTLLTIRIAQQWTMIKDGSDVRTIGFKPPGWVVTARGEGDLIVKFGYLFKLSLGIKFKFFWQINTPIVDIMFVLWIEWDVGAFFYVTSIGHAIMKVDNLLFYKKKLTFNIGPIPVILTPYIKIFVELESTKTQWFHGGVECHYNERLYMGFHFCTIPGLLCIPGPIVKKVSKRKGCEPKVGAYKHIRERDEGKELQCPRPDENKGFDLRINVQVGAILYSLVNMYLRMEFVIPFRTHYPVLHDPTVCGLPKHTDMCTITKETEWLKAHFWYSLDLNIYIGVFCEFKAILAMVLGIFGQPLPPAAAPEFEIKIAGPIPIIPKTSMGCVDLGGHWSMVELDTALRHSCCSHDHYLPIKPEHPYYDEMYLDYYNQRVADDDDYDPYPHYEDNDKDDDEINPYYYSPAYHIPIKMRPVMKEWEQHHWSKAHHAHKKYI